MKKRQPATRTGKPTERRAAKLPQPDCPDPSANFDAEKIAEFLGELPPDLPKEMVVSLVQSMSFSGPIPPPALLKEYEEALPGCAERLVQMAEREQGSRHVDNRKLVHNDRMRVVFAFLISLALIAAATLAIFFNQPEIAIPLGLAGTLTGIVRGVIEWINRDKKT
jgi:uncharacterized membrane protein